MGMGVDADTDSLWDIVFDDWGWVGEGAVGIDSLDDIILDDWEWLEVELEEGIGESEGVEAETRGDRSGLRLK